MWQANSANDPEKAQRAREMLRQRQAPENEIPVSVAADVMLVDAPEAVVFISGIRVYSSGVDLTVVAVARRARPRDDDGFPRGNLLFGSRRDSLVMGVEYADGRVGVAQGRGPMRQPVSDNSAVHLWSGGGGGGDRHATQNYFLTPVPPVGVLRFVTAWPAFDVAEQTTEVDVTGWAEAASRVRRLWEHGEDAPPVTPTPPPLPRGGWFEANEDRLRGS